MAQKSVFAVSLENRSQKQMDMSLAFIKAGNFSFGSSPGGLDLRRWLKDELLTTYAVPFFDTCCSTTPYNLEKYISEDLDNIISLGTDGLLYATAPEQGITSIDLSMPSAFTVSGTPITTSGTISVVGSGTSAQYIDGTGSLKTFPTLIPTASGGTGITTYNLGDTLYGNSSNTLSKLTGNTTIIPKVLMQTGTGSASAAPLWFDLFNTTNNWVAQNISNLGTSLGSGIPAIYLGYDSVYAGFIKVAGSSNSVTINTRSSFVKGLNQLNPGTVPTIAAVNNTSEVTTNFGGFIATWNSANSVQAGLTSYVPLFTVANKELGGSGYSASVPVFSIAGSLRPDRQVDHRWVIETLIPSNAAITSIICAEGFHIFDQTAATYSFKQHRIRQSFSIDQTLTTIPTAAIHIAASDGTASSAPLKFTGDDGCLMATPEQGAMEVNSMSELIYSTNNTTDSRGFVEVARYTAVSATYTVTPDDYTINCTSGTFNVTLPTANSIRGRIYKIKNSGAGTITVDTTGGQTIDGASTKTLSTQYQVITVQSTGANWIVL